MNVGNIFILLVVIIGISGCDIYFWLRLRDLDRSNGRQDADRSPACPVPSHFPVRWSGSTVTADRRSAQTAALIAIAFSASLAARWSGIVRLGGAGSGFDVLLLLGTICFGIATVVLVLLRAFKRVQ